MIGSNFEKITREPWQILNDNDSDHVSEVFKAAGKHDEWPHHTALFPVQRGQLDH